MGPLLQVFFNNVILVRRTREYIAESSTTNFMAIFSRQGEGVIESCSSNGGDMEMKTDTRDGILNFYDLHHRHHLQIRM